MLKQLRSRSMLFLLFTVSGFAGLIYESIWSHYLKLFLGHAAYAQTLVLAIFMGGMALGSWLCSRFSGGWKNLLVGYALAEAAIGACALAFHPLFVAATDAAFDSVLPALGSEFAATWFNQRVRHPTPRTEYLTRIPHQQGANTCPRTRNSRTPSHAAGF